MHKPSPSLRESTGSKNRLLAPLYKAYERFLKIRGNPREIALGFALGLFVGMTPLMGLHIAIAVPLAALFKWNKFSAAISVWITNAITAPLIYSITYLIGAKILGIEKTFSLKGFNSFSGLYKMITKAPEIALAMTVGGFILGLPLAVAGYYLTFSVIRKYREDIKRRIAISKEKRAHKKDASDSEDQAPPLGAVNPQADFAEQSQYAPPKNPPE